MALNPRQFPGGTHVHKSAGKGGFALITDPEQVDVHRQRLAAASRSSGEAVPDEIQGHTAQQRAVVAARDTVGSTYVCNNPSCTEKPATLKGKVKKALKGNAPPADRML